MKLSLAALDLKPEAALDYWRNKGLRIGDREFARINDRARDLAFTMAGVRKLHIMQGMKNAIQDSLQAGLTFDQAKNAFLRGIKAKGVGDLKSLTRYERRLARSALLLKDDHRLKTVFRTNISTAYHAGHWAAGREAAELGQERIIMYQAVMDSRTRDSHARLDGLTQPFSHEIWKRIWPPNDFNCRCTVLSIPPAMAKARGITVSGKDGMDMHLLDYKPSKGFNSGPPTKNRLTPHIDRGLQIIGEEEARAMPPKSTKIISGDSLAAKHRKRRQKHLEWFNGLGPEAKLAVKENFSDAVDVFAVEGHNITSRGLARHYIGLLPKDINENWTGALVSASDTDIKIAYRNLLSRFDHNLVGLWSGDVKSAALERGIGIAEARRRIRRKLTNHAKTMLKNLPDALDNSPIVAFNDKELWLDPAGDGFAFRFRPKTFIDSSAKIVRNASLDEVRYVVNYGEWIQEKGDISIADIPSKRPGLEPVKVHLSLK